MIFKCFRTAINQGKPSLESYVYQQFLKTYQPQYHKQTSYSTTVTKCKIKVDEHKTFVVAFLLHMPFKDYAEFGQDFKMRAGTSSRSDERILNFWEISKYIESSWSILREVGEIKPLPFPLNYWLIIRISFIASSLLTSPTTKAYPEPFPNIWDGESCNNSEWHLAFSNCCRALHLDVCGDEMFPGIKTLLQNKFSMIKGNA